MTCLVPGDGAGQLGGQRADGFAHCLAGQAGVTPAGQVQQQQQVAGGALDQGADGGAAILADGQVAFPACRP
jgi:hypothetical protein